MTSGCIVLTSNGSATPQRDPIPRMQMFLIREGILDEKGINKLEKEVEDEMQTAVDRALEAQFPTPETDHQLYLLARHRSDLVCSLRRSRYFRSSREAPAGDGKKPAAPLPKTMADLINATLRDEMRRDERIVIFGEDVADCSREEHLKQKLVKGKGGVFKLTAGLQMEFGSRSRLQLAHRGGEHCGPRDRHGDARIEAGGRDSVLRLHLARDDAVARRAARSSAGARTTHSHRRW